MPTWAVVATGAAAIFAVVIPIVWGIASRSGAQREHARIQRNRNAGTAWR